MSLEQQIKDQALALGFDAVGITDASPIGAEHIEHFEAWLRRGYAGRMDYMYRNLEKRIDPAKLLDGAKSIIVVALNYKSPASAAAVQWAGRSEKSRGEGVGTPNAICSCWGTHAAQGQKAGASIGRVAQYAQYEDYHRFIKSLLTELIDFVRTRTDPMHRFKVCVDSAPLAEKALAVRAGLGFVGRNHLLVHPQLGPQVLLGEIVTTMSLRPDGPVAGSCAGCDRCFRACPAGALRSDGFLDASRCISYLTQYGSQGEPAERTGVWLFGCDECLLACPFQQAAPACANRRFQWYADRAELNLQEVLELTPEEFEARFHDSPVRGLGLETLKRNARRCLKLQV